MGSPQSKAEKAGNASSPLPQANDLLDYWVDAWQRAILLVDLLLTSHP